MRARTRRLPLAVRVLLAAVVLLAAGCGGDAAGHDGPADGSGAPSGDLRVFAAASLTEAFSEMGEAFEAAHPDVAITFSFAGSSALAHQIRAGAPADVFASADEATMAAVRDAGLVGEPVTMARNGLALLVERGNPKGITGLADLAEPGMVVVVCAPEVPCGRFARAALGAAGVDVRPSSLEENVKAVASKVVLGEADAGIVYATDVRAAGDRAEAVTIDGADPPSLEVVHPVAVTTGAQNRGAARAWVDFVLSERGRAVLAAHGFLVP